MIEYTKEEEKQIRKEIKKFYATKRKHYNFSITQYEIKEKPRKCTSGGGGYDSYYLTQTGSPMIYTGNDYGSVCLPCGINH